jgi:hypothetical protein
VLLSGEPGIGKTRLAAYAAQAAHGDGWAVVWGACSEDLGVPYEPWIEVCSQLVENAPVELLERYVERHGGELSRLARGLSRRVPEAPAPQTSDPETERFLLFSAVAGLLTELSGSVPVVLVLDDFHWADGQSIALLKHVTRTAEQSAVQVLVTYRESDLGKDHPLSGLLADLHQVQGVYRIALHGLGPDEVAQVLTAAAGHELDEDGLALAGEIATETGGSPFFVGEVLRSLLESGRLLYDEETGRWSVDRSSAIGLPQSVREVIERRVERLGDEIRQILTVAAVIGQTFDVELLTRLIDLDESHLLDHLEAAVAASLLDESTEEVGRFRFVHALINQTLYEALGATRRARMHHAVGEALEELYGAATDEHLGELALHWRLATVAVDRPKAAAYAARAGQQALDRLAPAEAARLFGDAVELLGADETVERCRALIGLGEAQRLIGNASHHETLLEASRIAAALQDGELAARAVLANTRGLPMVIGETDQELLSAIEGALELDDQSNPGRRARLLGNYALELSYDEEQFARRRAIADEGIALGRDSGDPAALAAVLQDAGQAVWSADTVPQCAEMMEEKLGAAARAQDPALLWWAKHDEAVISVVTGQLDRAAAALKEIERIADELAQPALRWHAAAVRSSWELIHGHFDAADEHRERALALGQEAVPLNSALYYAAQLTFLRTHQGRGEEIITVLEGSVANYPGIPAWRAGLAAAYSRIGRLDEARTIVEDAARDGFAHIPHDPIRMMALVLYADAAAHTASVEAAEYLYELLMPWGDQVVYTDALGYGHTRMYLGELTHTLGRHELAIEHLEFACRFHEANGVLLWGAESHVWLARAFAAGGDAVAARAHAERALELARENGFGQIEGSARTLMSAGVSAGT